MRQKAQRAAGGHGGILLAQRPRGGIARIGEDARAREPRVERNEIGLGHIDLAANLEDFGRVAGKPLRDIQDCAHIGRHVLADLPVAARRRLDQHAVLITQRAAQPVDLGLRRQRDRCVGGKVQEASHPRDDLGHLVIGKGVVEAQHRAGVRHLGERGGRRRPHRL